MPSFRSGVQRVDKSPDAFRTISEVADDLDLPQHVLRFWETRFNQIRPMKRGGGRRYYRPDDVELLRGIRHLLYGEGYTIKGVQRILKEQGVRFVMEIWRHPGMPIPNERPAGPAAAPTRNTPAHAVLRTLAAVRTPPKPDPDEIAAAEAQASEPDEPGAAEDEEPLPAGILSEESHSRGGFRFMERFRSHDPAAPMGGLSREDIRRLQATLFELLECKRLLDQTR